jgi:regulator of sigma E protease
MFDPGAALAGFLPGVFSLQTLSVLWAIVVFVLVLMFLVIIHELGHFFAARWAKIRAKEFGIGIPPKAAELFTWQGTVFTLNWLPIGGFVQMEGEDAYLEDVDEPVDSAELKDDEIGPFYEKVWWKRLVVILAGATVNFVFGIIAFAVVYSFWGIPQPPQVIITETIEESAAAAAQIPAPVELITFQTAAGEEVTPSAEEDVSAFIQSNLGQEIDIVTSEQCNVVSAGVFSCPQTQQRFTVTLPSAEEVGDAPALGIAFDFIPTLERFPWYEMPLRGIATGIEQSISLAWLILVTLQDLVVELTQSQQVSEQLSGPVGIADQAVEYRIFEQGPLAILHFAGLLSINLAIMNVLPIPALDGGRAVFILLGRVIEEKKVQRIEGYFNYAGFIALIGLILLITYFDIRRLFMG